MDPLPQHYASDNYSGICPEAWAAMAQANAGHAPAYGEDLWTQRAADAFRTLFETDCDVYFTFNGTAANALALATLCQSYHAIICASTSHIETSECGAPEFFSNGAKLLVAETSDGRLTEADVRRLGAGGRELHFPKPKAVSITQATETGRVYRPSEISALTGAGRDLGLRLHMDGARFANACAELEVHPADLTWRAGVDVLCFGGTKNGMAFGEAVVFFDRSLSADFAYRCKQAGQLASKMRFLAAPWVGMLESGAWLANARRANAFAWRLAKGIAHLKGVHLAYPVEANAVFVKTSEAVLEAVRAKGWRFYVFEGGAARFMCGWDADVARVDALIADLREAAEAAG